MTRDGQKTNLESGSVLGLPVDEFLLRTQVEPQMQKANERQPSDHDQQHLSTIGHVLKFLDAHSL